MPPAWSPTTRYPSANATEDELPRGDSESCCSNVPVEASHAYRFPSHVLTNTVPLLYAGEVPTAPPGMKLSQTIASSRRCQGVAAGARVPQRRPHSLSSRSTDGGTGQPSEHR